MLVASNQGTFDRVIPSEYLDQPHRSDTIIELHTIAQAWRLPEPLHFRPISVGFMNLSCFIDTPAGSFVLRVYQTQTELARIRFEHALTAWLQQAGLSFTVPVPVPSPSGDTLVRVPCAEAADVLAALIPVIPGTHPVSGNIAHSYAAGAALGELTGALASLPAEMVDRAGSTYRDLRTTHPEVPDLCAVMERLPLSPEWRTRMLQLIGHLLGEGPRLHGCLPRQVIHGDCTNGNVLLIDDRTVGFLDFEFAGYDVRAMDFAVGLGGGPSGQRGPGATWDELEAFARGYALHTTLTVDELVAVPTLISLRRTAMLAHFAHRWQQGLDSEDFIVDAIIGWVLEGEDWLAADGDELLRRLMGWFRP